MSNQYRKKPVVIEAIQWNGAKFEDTPPEWFRAAMYAEPGTPGFLMRIGDKLVIETLEGQVWAAPGDWIIRGVKGELYPCKPDIFAATYEAAAPVPASTGRVKDHVLREVVNNLRDIAVKFHAAGQLRERLSGALDPLLVPASTGPEAPPLDRAAQTGQPELFSHAVDETSVRVAWPDGSVRLYVAARELDVEAERRELAQRLEIMDAMLEQERMKNAHLLDVLMSVYRLAPNGQDIKLPDGRVFRFNDPNAAETLNALGRAIHAIPEKAAQALAARSAAQGTQPESAPVSTEQAGNAP